VKKYILFVYLTFIGAIAQAQDINLTDSIIYFGTTPVAYYVKALNESDPHYNVYVISLDKKILIAAQVVKFKAPSPELKSFYYYDLIFHNEKDTVPIYYQGQAFTLELASLIQQYKLIDSNKIDTNALARFKKEYRGNAALQAKIKEYEKYFIDRRNYNEQTVRDRTKPVIIVADRSIMQDGKLIAIIEPGFYDVEFPNEAPRTIRYSKYILPNGRDIGPGDVQIHDMKWDYKAQTPPSLFDISIPFNPGRKALLFNICQYVENFLM
jgi:hypothetical protein